MGWGLSLAGGVRVVLSLVVRGLSLVGSLAGGCLGCGSVLAPEGPAPPPLSVGMGVFFLVFFILALAVGLLSPKKQKCGSNEWKCM